MLDEPFTSLAPQEECLLTSIIKKAAQCGKSIVVATHDVKWIDAHCFDLVVLSNGRNLANGQISFYRDEADYLNLRKEYLKFSVRYESHAQKE